MLNIGIKIKELRELKNITQSTLAKEINVTRQAIAMYETNQRKPSYEILISIAKYFETTTDYLLGLKED